MEVLIIILTFLVATGLIVLSHNLGQIRISIVKIQNLLERIEMIEKAKIK